MGFTRYSTYKTTLAGNNSWIKIWEDRKTTITDNKNDNDQNIENLKKSMLEITNACEVQKFIKGKSEGLYNEFQNYWIEGEYTNDSISALDDTTMDERISLANELLEAGQKELKKISQPTFELSVSAINFLKLIDFMAFGDELELGRVITVERDDNTHYRPALTSIEYDLDDSDTFALTFSTAAKLNETAMTFADLLNETSSTSRTVSANWSNLTDYSKNKQTIDDLLKNPLDRTLRAAESNMSNQAFVIDSNGILGRRWSDDSHTAYENQQMRIANNTIIFTDDGWKTIRTALGKISYNHYSEDEKGEMVVSEAEGYGLATEVLVGNLMLTSQMQIINENGSIKLDENGIVIKNGTNDVFKADIGKFAMYDSNVTITISSTTNTTYSGTLVIATQNIDNNHGGTYVANVYGDVNGTLTSKLVIIYRTTSRWFEIYCDFPGWSKNLIRIQGVGLQAEPTNVVTTVTTIPTDNKITVTNLLASQYVPVSRKVNSKTLSSDVTLTQDDVGDGTTYKRYSQTEKEKLSGVESGAQKNTVTGIKGNAETSYRVGNVNITKANVGLGNVDNVKQYSASNPNFGTNKPQQDGTAAVGTATTYSRSDHVHPTDESRASTATATTSANGLMSATDKTKLDGLPEDSVRYGSQTLTDAQKTQARTNIGAGTSNFDGNYNNLSNKPSINNGVLTIQKNGSTIQTFSANQSGNVTANLIIPTKTSDLTNNSGYNYEAYINWGGKHLVGKYSPIDANMNVYLSPNRLAGMNIAGITIEYSNDGGTTWVDYGASDAVKGSLVTTTATIKIGGSSKTAGSVTANDMLRVTLDGVDGGVYTAINKVHIWVTTNGSSNCTVSLESYDYNSSTEWHSVIANQSITGWSAWNVLNFNLPGSGAFGGTNSATHQRKIRFTFKHDSCTSDRTGLQISRLYAYGGMGWSTPSYLSTTGTPYTYDYASNVTFPANVKAPTFTENGTALSKKYLALGGGTMTGNLRWSSSVALPENTSPKYFLSIDSFAEGGTTKWVTLANAKSALGVPTNYTGSSSAGGSATSAVKLDTSAGSAIQPVYFVGGKPSAIGYTIRASVPSDAKFTDSNTTYDLSAPASKTNGNVTINLTAGGSGSGTDSITIKGTGTATVTTDSSGNIVINSIQYFLQSFGVSATAAELNTLKGITATTTELNYTKGVKSNIQTQLDGKEGTLSDAQRNAVNSGITLAKVSTYDGYESSISAKYTKPSTGIPKSDLASSVQTSLGKADTALQSHQSLANYVPTSRSVNGKTLESDVTLTQDDVGDGTTYKRYSATEKTKLAGIAEGANKYVHPAYSPKMTGLYKFSVDTTGHILSTSEVQKSDITALGIPGSVPTSVDGMSGGTITGNVNVTGSLGLGGYSEKLNARTDGLYYGDTKITLDNMEDWAKNHSQTQLTNEDLNELNDEDCVGWYYASYGNTCTNTPLGAGLYFMLEVGALGSASADSDYPTLYYQRLISSYGRGTVFYRIMTPSGNSSSDYTWLTWKQVAVGGTINDGKLVIQKNGTTIATFSANQSSNVVANIEVDEGSSSSSELIHIRVSSTRKRRGENGEYIYDINCTVDSGLDNLQVGDRFQLCRPVKNVEKYQGTVTRARYRYKVIPGDYYEVTQDDIDRIASRGQPSTFTIPVEYYEVLNNGDGEIVKEYKWTYTKNYRFRTPLVVRVQRANDPSRFGSESIQHWTISNQCKIITKGVNTESAFTLRPL